MIYSELPAFFLPANENGVLNKEMMARGGGRLFERGACFIFWPTGVGANSGEGAY